MIVAHSCTSSAWLDIAWAAANMHLHQNHCSNSCIHLTVVLTLLYALRATQEQDIFHGWASVCIRTHLTVVCPIALRSDTLSLTLGKRLATPGNIAWDSAWFIP